MILDSEFRILDLEFYFRFHMNRLLLIFFLVTGTALKAQPRVYTVANAHSHNDYERPSPFWEAYKHGFGSIEADIYLLDSSEKLFVAHTRSDLDGPRRTLDSLYLVPLSECIRKNNGFVYADRSRKLQLLIDIKTAAVPTLNRLVTVLKQYPELIRSTSLQIVISGNRPAADSFHLYPSFIHFDGVIGIEYSQKALSKIPLFSASFGQFSTWKGHDALAEKERLALTQAISDVHKLGKPVRLWAAPDSPSAWKRLMELQVDYINTDRISELSGFLQKSK